MKSTPSIWMHFMMLSDIDEQASFDNPEEGSE
jgi:hypothetical protein